MSTLSLAQHNQQTHLHHLGTFLTWLLPTLVVVTAVEIILLLLYRSTALSIASAATFFFAIALFFARLQVSRHNLQAAVTITGSGFLVFSLAMIIALPELMTAVTLLPIFAIITVLPYIESHTLKYWIIAVWITTTTVVMLGEFVMLFPSPPPMAISIIQLACMTPGMGLLLLLVWQFHNRMTDSLHNIQATNDTLQETKKHLEANVSQLEAANEVKVAREHIEEVVKVYSHFAHRVAQGDLTARLVIDSNHDELALLGESLNTMVESLQLIAGNVQQASSSIASAANEITTVTTHQAASIAQKSAAINQTTTTIQEIKTIATQVTQNANQVAQESHESLHVARQGLQAIDETTKGMNQIHQRVESIAETILTLSEQTQAIGMITATVSELADQSNLLALNAAIEAARAGEQGKSFAVVAQQVRDLAERSKAATVQVREILDEIRQATNKAVIVTEEGTKEVKKGIHVAHSAGEVIKRIANQIEHVSQTNVQMSAASGQAKSGIEQIGNAMVSIQQTTNELAAGMNEAKQAAVDLQGLAQSLQHVSAAYTTA